LGTELTHMDDGPVATVYSGQRGGVPMALKVFPRRFDKRTLTAFNKEQAKLATVRRVSSILPVVAVVESENGESALWMELCTQSLFALVEREGRLPAQDVVILGHAMATALAAAHNAGVVHGGVSPNNVLFRASREPVLADFGVTLRQAFTRDPLHAIEYLPPEALRTGTLDESTDLYGLGAVLHYALSGSSPHPGRLGEQPGERVLRILGEPVPALTVPDVPVGLSTLVARLLASTPDRRPQDANTVATLLAKMLPAPPPQSTPEDWDDFTPTPAMPYPIAGPYVPALEGVDGFDDFGSPPGSAYGGPQQISPSRPAPYEQIAPPRTQAPATAASLPGRVAAPAAQADPLAAPMAAPPASAVVSAEPSVGLAAQGVAPTRAAVSPVDGAALSAEIAVPSVGAGSPAASTPTAGPGGPSLTQGVSTGASSPLGGGRLPLAPPPVPAWAGTMAPGWRDGVATQELPTAARYGADDMFNDFGPPSGRRGVTLLATMPPAKQRKRLIRYDLLAGAALVLALLALVPLLLLRGNPEEISSSPILPAAGGTDDVTVELAAPTDLTDKVRLDWKASRELDFAVVIAAEGEKARVVLADRNHSMTVDVEPGVKYCFMVQASDGDQVYESEARPLRGAVCRK
jgi:serine/threonine protein kinase